MPEQHDIAQPPQVASHGCTCGAHPITRSCPVSCLAVILSAGAFNPLARACDRACGPGATVGHVADLHLQDRLTGIDGLGLSRIREIEVGLGLAGLIGAADRVRAGDRAAEAYPDTFPDLLKLAEVAAAFRVHPRTIIRWAEAGKLPCFRTAGGHRRFRAADVRALLAAAWAVGQQARQSGSGKPGQDRRACAVSLPRRRGT
jgi:excisionase family DNA binding protein